MLFHNIKFSEDKVIFINFSILFHRYTINIQLLKKENKFLTLEIRLLQEDNVNNSKFQDKFKKWYLQRHIFFILLNL